MIPKIIHYCWFGRGPLPKLAEDCIDSWRRSCPDYEIIEWNEDNFDVNQNDFVKEAYESKKYAFVSDCARLYALFTMGGVYLDIDVELLGSLDKFLEHEGFLGFEVKEKIATSVIGAEKEHETVKLFLDYYNDKHFILPDGRFDTVTNVEIITNILTPLGLEKNGCLQTVAGLTLYPRNVFGPILSRTNDAEYMKDTVAIHYFLGSWKSERARRRESSRLFRILITPIRLLSRLFTLLFGKRWTSLKNKIRARVLRD